MHAADDHRFECVSRVPLFAALPEADRRRIAAAARTRAYGRGQRIYGPGDRAGLHIVHRGRVKVYRITSSGTEQLVRVLSPGDFLGEAALLADATADHFAEAVGPSEVCSVGRAEVAELLARRSDVALQMLQTVSGRLHTAEQRLSALTGQSAEQRLAEHLLLLSAEAESPRFRLATTKKDLASYLGTTAETLSRRLGVLQDAGVLRLGPGRTVEVLDPVALRAAAR